MPTVYVETTIPSFYFESRSDEIMVAWRSATRIWWHNARDRYQLLTSEVVRAELRRAPPAKSRAALRLIEDLQSLEANDAATQAAEFYLAHRLVPADAATDALHIALCSVHSIDFLLTWNCRDLANANKARHLAVLNGRLGLSTPTITTPYSLLSPPTDP